MKILLLNQCFYPDVVSSAQHTSDLARGLVQRGHDVTVIASSRGYDDPSLRFPLKENWNGVRILRVPCLATGKGNRRKRALNIASFFLTCILRLTFMGRFDVIMALTSPPLISALGAAYARLRGGRFVFWVMDLNPDEAIAAGWLRADSRLARLLESVLRFSAQAADRVVVLDRFMQERMTGKGVSASKIMTLPPWSHDDVVQYDVPGRTAFRQEHELEGKFVVMYSGNHSPCHPLDTVLQAVLRLRDEKDTVFCFAGGGSEHGKVRAFATHHGLNNVRCMPYQPLAKLSASLSAADLHLVVLGQALAGLVHPCKVYNVLTIGIPVLFVGPVSSHVGDIADKNPGAPITCVKHGDVVGLVERIRAGAVGAVPNLALMRASRPFSADRLVPRYIEMIERSGMAVEKRVEVFETEERPLTGRQRAKG